MTSTDTKVTKRIINTSFASVDKEDEHALDIPALATILVTSEDPAYPIDHIFSRQQEKACQRWVAAEPGKQYFIIDFDKPQNLRCITIEMNEEEKARSQELTVSISDDDGKTYRRLFRQEFNFSPPGTTCEKERWSISENRITHICFCINPDKSGGTAKATVTSLVLY